MRRCSALVNAALALAVCGDASAVGAAFTTAGGVEVVDLFEVAG